MSISYYKARKASLRLSCHDYSSPRCYYITILTRDRERFFGEIINNKMELSEIGKVVSEQWFKIPVRFPDVTLDEFVVMPNHIHGILIKNSITREELNAAKRPERSKEHLSKIIGLYKAGCTRIINTMQDNVFFGWHKNYYDNVVRNEKALNEIRTYIQNNPLKWREDEYA